MILSIIVPTYNVEDYIERCLRSLLNQNLNKNLYEIIVVNDGTNDRSAEIAAEIAKTNKQIVVINQVNGGLSNARNTGIRNANGKYLLFVDSDDYLTPNVLADMVAFTEQNVLEIAMFSHKLIEINKNEILYEVPSAVSEVMHGMDLFFKRTVDCACQYIINSEFLKSNNLYFHDEARFLEDAEWSGRLFCMASRAAYKNIIFYNYELRPGSLITSNFSVSDRAIKSYISSTLNLKKFQSNVFLSTKQKEFLNNSIVKFAVLPINMIASDKNFKMLSVVKSMLNEAGIKKLELKYIKGFKRRQGVLFNLSHSLLFFFFIIFYAKKALLLKLRNKRYFKSIFSYSVLIHFVYFTIL